MRWTSIYPEPERGLKKLMEIAYTLFKNDLAANTGLMWGKTGVALFFFYYAKFKRQEKYHDYAVKIIDNVFDEVSASTSNPYTISEGLAGIGWTIEHLSKNKLCDISTDEMLEDVDHFLTEALELEIKENNYQYLHGYLGIGWYFISRLPGEKAKNCLNLIIEALEKQGIQNEDKGIKWQSLADRETGKMGYDLSLARGISGIIAFLSKLYELNIRKDLVERMLSGAVEYLLRQTLDVRRYKSAFPRWADDPSDSKIEWGFGDPGIGVALWHAARRTGNKKWEEEAMRILLHSAARRDFREEKVSASGLLNGTAGLAQVYNRMFHYTGVETFKDSAKHWIDVTLGMAFKPDGLAGYKVWRHLNNRQGWTADPGFLEGISGIGLTLISSISDIEPSWDNCLFLS
jgi:lantibiotic biosynthesis protein